jgi:hypothetical protein
MNTPAVRRDANGRLLSGVSLNPGGRPVSAITELRAKYLPRLDELMEELMELATNSQNEMVRLAAIRLVLDHLVGRPAVSVDTTVTKMDLGELYRQALIRANSPAVGGNGEIEKSTIAATEIQ